MENRFKLRISRMFRSSFGSCRTQNFSDVMDRAVSNVPQNHHRSTFQMIEPFSPKKSRSFPSICKPHWSETSESFKDSNPRRKVSERSSPFILGDLDGRSCPPASPVSPLNINPFYDCNEFGFTEKFKTLTIGKKNKRKKKKKKKKRSTQMKSKCNENFPFISSSIDKEFGGCWWYDSDEDYEGEDETETLFSSKSLTSDSSVSRRRRRYSGQKNHGFCRRRSDISVSEMGALPLQGKVKDTFAVVKRSSDPHNDFRTSMVEMIVEKQIFAQKDLENLLQCFLSLNSHHHHRTIVEVFMEIWEALFSNWS